MLKTHICLSAALFCTWTSLAAAAQETSTYSAQKKDRSFGISLGAGLETATGNRGLLWQSASPSFDLKAMYWFDFPLSFQIGYSKSSHYFESTLGPADYWHHVNVSTSYLYLDSKYSFGPAWMPSLILGFGQAFKSESDVTVSSQDRDNGFLMNLGLSGEIPLAPRISLVPEWRYRFVQYKDTYTSLHAATGIEDLSGGFHSFTLSLLSSW